MYIAPSPKMYGSMCSATPILLSCFSNSEMSNNALVLAQFHKRMWFVLDVIVRSKPLYLFAGHNFELLPIDKHIQNLMFMMH